MKRPLNDRVVVITGASQELTLRGLRVGASGVDLRFRRRPDGSASWRVVGRSAPGRLARAAHIALGRGS